MEKLSAVEVQLVRDRFATARDLAAARFREAFAADTSLPPNERWRAHLEIQALSMLENLTAVRLRPSYRIAVFVDESEGRRVIPVVVAADASIREPQQVEKATASVSLYPFFQVDRTVVGLFEYFLFTSELMSSSAWQVTSVITDAEEYNTALAKMEQPQIVNALYSSFEPAADFRSDGTSFLDVTLYTRAQEERIERRTLLLDQHQEFHFHNRQLVAEGKGGVFL